MKRSQLKRTKGLRQVSPKRRKRLADGETAWRREELARRYWCEIGPRLAAAGHMHWRGGCLGRASELHEVIKRSRGGSTTDADNCLAVCRRCHSFSEEEVEESTRLGLLAHAVTP